MDSPIVKVDDKHLPLYRIVWVSDLPHFCGDDECEREGQYEIRLDVEIRCGPITQAVITY